MVPHFLLTRARCLFCVLTAQWRAGSGFAALPACLLFSTLPPSGPAELIVCLWQGTVCMFERSSGRYFSPGLHVRTFNTHRRSHQDFFDHADLHLRTYTCEIVHSARLRGVYTKSSTQHRAVNTLADANTEDPHSSCSLRLLSFVSPLVFFRVSSSKTQLHAPPRALSN